MPWLTALEYFTPQYVIGCKFTVQNSVASFIVFLNGVLHCHWLFMPCNTEFFLLQISPEKKCSGTIYG